MAFSTATITHTFQNADGTAASGSVKFTLSRTMTNGTTTIVPASITAALNGSGVLSQSLTSNVDTATWSLSSTASSGSFSLAFSNTPEGVLTTAGLTSGATAAQVQAAIQALSGLSAVTCTGGPLGGTITIANVPGNLTLAVTNSTLSGGSATLTQTVTGTTPAAPLNAQWRVDFDLLGAGTQDQSYYIVVPAGGGTIDLGTLLPNTRQVG